MELNEEENSKSTALSREGTIKYLRENINENQMIILGEVGMGKSTTLQYLHLQDAKFALENKNSKIPIYFELKNLTSEDNILHKMIARLNIDKEFALEMLKRGEFIFYLDGLNEIEKKIKVGVFNQIRNLMTDYTKNFFLITSRPQNYNREFDNVVQNIRIPVFNLQKMKDSQIDEFLDKNGKNVKVLISNEIKNNERLKRIIQTPLMLTMLISVVQKEGKIPVEKGKIIRSFIHNLYLREQRQSLDFDLDTFHLLLCYLGYETRALTGSNSGIDRDEFILPILEERKKQLGLTINLLDFLRKAIDLDLLINEENQVSFCHEQFQEYYAAEYLHQVGEN